MHAHVRGDDGPGEAKINTIMIMITHIVSSVFVGPGFQKQAHTLMIVAAMHRGPYQCRASALLAWRM